MLNRSGGIFKNQPEGMIYTSSHLSCQGLSLKMQKRLRDIGVLESIGKVAMIKKGQKPDIMYAIHAIQQLGLEVHIGAITSYILHRQSHYVFFIPPIKLFSSRNVYLPNWFTNYPWDNNVKFFTTNPGIKL